MPRDLKQLLRDTAAEPNRPLDPSDLVGRARHRTWATRTAIVVVAVAAVAVGALGIQQFMQTDQPPQITDQPPVVPNPTVQASEPTARDTEAAARQRLDALAVGSTLVLDGGATFESRYADATLVRSIEAGVSYPDRIYGLPDGTAAWQADGDVYVLGPDDDSPTLLIRSAQDDPSHRLGLVGVGDIDGLPVLLVDEAQASSPEADNGRTLWAYRLDGGRDALVEFDSSWEQGVSHASLLDGWLLYTDSRSADDRAVLRAPDGTEAILEAASGEQRTMEAADLARIDLAPGVAVVTHYVEHGDPEAPFGAGRLEIRSVNDPTGQPARVIDLPTDNVPKHLTVAAEWAFLTLLPDSEQLLQVDLHSGQIDRFSAPGIVALHEAIQPRRADAAPAAECVDLGGAGNDDAQAYVWLPCPDAATHDDDDPAADYFGIHKLRLVTDPAASSGGVDQRVQAMLETIFAGPTSEERTLGYQPIIDPSTDVLSGVTFDAGLVIIELTDEGARAATIGTSARAIFMATVETAIFQGFVDVDAIRFTVEGDCMAWSVYGEGPDACFTYHRDGTATES